MTASAMKPLTHGQRRALHRLQKRQEAGLPVAFVRGRNHTRLILVLVRRGLVYATPSKHDLFGCCAYPWKELAVSLDPKALAYQGTALIPAGIKIRAWR